MERSWILDILFPPECLVCKDYLPSGVLCKTCHAAIPFAPNLADATHAGSVTKYENTVVTTLIHELKFNGIKNAAAPLSELLIRYALATELVDNLNQYYVVPIPLSKQRLRERGFNQSTLIATPFTQRFAIPMRGDILSRTKNRKPQSSTTSLQERKENIRGCFEAKSCNDVYTNTADPPGVILIDDVTTSGTTFLEAITALKRAGWKNVIALAVAQA